MKEKSIVQKSQKKDSQHSMKFTRELLFPNIQNFHRFDNTHRLWDFDSLITYDYEGETDTAQKSLPKRIHNIHCNSQN